MNHSSIFTVVLMVTIIATVTSFGPDLDNMDGAFGHRDYFDRMYQSWMDKRSLGNPSYFGFGRPVGNAHRYFNWKDFLAKAITKRQLAYAPRSFGNYRKYFSNGLQDWKNTFTGLYKRQASAGDEPAAGGEQL